MSGVTLLGLAEGLLGVASVGVAVPAGMLLLECLAAAWPAAGTPADVLDSDGADAPAPRPRAAVLIPAHDEEAGLGDTLASLRPQLRPGDRLLVVADNCRDATAEVARRGGAEVVERRDAERRGKGWALRFGIDALRGSDVETVVVVDADGRCAPGALDALVAASARHGVPVQARYSFEPPTDPSPGQALSALALLVRNHVRPLGLARLGGPCPLFGCGMGFPLAQLERHPPRGESVVEDLEHGIDLTCAGHPPRYVPEARVTSALPRDDGAARQQRRRREHGHIHALGRGVPRLLMAGLRGGGRAPIALGLDLWIPPLSLHLALGAALLGLGAGLLALGGTPFVAGVAALSLAGSVAGLGLAWARFGRGLVSPAHLLAAPLYAARKLPLYAGFLVRRQREWRRTPRDSSGGDDSTGADG